MTLTLSACQNIVSTTPLKVGDCFNYINTTDANGDPINVPQVIDCAQPHSDEVFSIFDYPNAPASPAMKPSAACSRAVARLTSLPTSVSTGSSPRTRSTTPHPPSNRGRAAITLSTACSRTPAGDS